MTISKVNGAGWAFGAKLTAAQMNSFDTKLITALDKTSAGDDLEGPITLSGAGRFIVAPSTGPNADTTFQVGNGDNICVVTNSVTADRTYTLGTTGVATGDSIEFFCLSSFNYTITIQVAGPTTMFTLGNGTSADGKFARFVYVAGSWYLASQSQGSREHQEVFTANGSWTCPRGVTSVLLVGCGGGGGGAGGYPGNTSTDVYRRGGGGGAGAPLRSERVAVTPGVTYTVTIGTGGPGGGSGADGSAGVATTFDSLATFRGGRGGRVWGGSAADDYVSDGGGPNAFSSGYRAYGGFDPVPQNGGYGGRQGVVPQPGGDSAAYVGGGAAGAGVDSGSYRAGGGGGGGGAGPYGNGSGGADGGAGNNAGSGSTGLNAGNGGANTGAGAGGGGGGGCGSAAGGAGGAGGTGGSGKLIVCWVK